MISIGVINDAGMMGKNLILLWVNYLTRSFPIRFIQGTDRNYFENLKKILKGEEISTRLYFAMDFFLLRKKILFIEIYPENLFREETRINEDKATLVESHALLYISNYSLTQPSRIFRLILKKKGRRRFLKKMVRDPFAIVINYEGIITPSFLSFLKDRFKKYEIFRVNGLNIEKFLDSNNEIYIKPIIWIFNKITGLSFNFNV